MISPSRLIAALVVGATLPAIAPAAGIYSPTVIHGTTSLRPSTGASVQSPAAPGGVVSIAPTVVLGWGGLPPSQGHAAPLHPGRSVHPGAHGAPGVYGSPGIYGPPGFYGPPGYHSSIPMAPGILPPGASPGSSTLHRWGAP